MDKKLFIETIEAIESQYRHDQECSKAFSVILPDDHISLYDNHKLTSQLSKLVKVAMNDDHDESWIEYFMWELDFGKNYSKGCIIIDGIDFKLKTAEDLWDLLNLK